MSAEDRLKEGDLEGALAELQQQVRREPDKARHRTFLFQLLAVLGQWDRALNQLNVAGELDPETLPMVQTYREAIRCEVLRQEIFNGTRSPLVFGDPEQWIALLLEAVRATAQGEYQRGQEVREQAFELAPTTAGTLDGQPFDWIADADPRMGPVLEALVNGNYYWIPLNRIRRIQVEAPSDLRDVVWMPANFVWANGGETVGLIPTRYPGTAARADNALKLARKTEWEEHPGGVYLGVGQRMFATDAGEYPLMDTREIQLAVEAASAG